MSRNKYPDLGLLSMGLLTIFVFILRLSGRYAFMSSSTLIVKWDCECGISCVTCWLTWLVLSSGSCCLRSFSCASLIAHFFFSHWPTCLHRSPHPGTSTSPNRSFHPPHSCPCTCTRFPRCTLHNHVFYLTYSALGTLNPCACSSICHSHFYTLV